MTCDCREYLENIAKVDGGIESVVSRLNEFYANDERTAYVFTADHGMTDWGERICTMQLVGRLFCIYVQLYSFFFSFVEASINVLSSVIIPIMCFR